jgi:general secretion pathway protein G
MEMASRDAALRCPPASPHECGPQPGRNVHVRQVRSTAANLEPEAGFTLLELLVVIAILGLLTALVGPRLFNILGGAKKSLATQQIENIGGALDLYKLDVGSYPTGDQGLAALATKPNDVDNWNGPYTKTGGVPMDPWNHQWTYHNPSTRQGHDYDLCSGGPAGGTAEPGQTDAICNP